MKFFIPLMLSLFVTVPAKAELITCVFTEPFFSIDIDTAELSFVKTEPDWSSKGGGVITTLQLENIEVTERNFKEGEPVQYVMSYEEDEIMTLALDYQGSDGMSDRIYPYSAEYDGYFGGCYSETLEATFPDDI